MEILTIFFSLQAVNTILAVFLNFFLIYLVVNHTRNKVGYYKWIIVSFAVFEAVYAMIVLIGMPVHYVAEGSWLVFNNGGLLGNTPFSFLGPSLYCTFYEIWIGFIVLHFVYRYVAVCKEKWLIRLQFHWKWKLAVFVFLIDFLLFTGVCGLFLCSREVITKTLENKVRLQFNMENNTTFGYILLRHTHTNGGLSIVGTSTIFNHYILVLLSSIIIIFCTAKIWRKIAAMQKRVILACELRLHKQMFLSLVIQTLVPAVFCHIPSVVFLSFPFWNQDFSFGLASLFFTWLTSVSKFVDPIIVIFCIREYKEAALKLFREPPKKRRYRIPSVTLTAQPPVYSFADAGKLQFSKSNLACLKQ